MLVALASSTFMVVSTHFVYFQHYHRDDLVSVDPSRIAASVVAGTGFLAGGAILRTGLSVQGLTTGAGLWLVSSIGLAAGGGMYPESLGATVIGLVALSVVRRFEGKDDGAVRRRVAVTTVGGADALPGLVAAIRAAGCAVSDSEYESVREEGRLTVAFDVDAPSPRLARSAAPRRRESARRGARPDRPARLTFPVVMQAGRFHRNRLGADDGHRGGR